MALTNDEKFKIWWQAEQVKMRHESEERGSTAEDFRNMKKRNEAAVKNPPPRGIRAAAGKVVDWLEKEPPKRKRSSSRSRGNSGGIGSGLNMADFIPSNMGLGQRMGYEPMPHQGPKRKKKSSRNQTGGARGGGGNWMNPGYIPPELEWMF